MRSSTRQRAVLAKLPSILGIKYGRKMDSIAPLKTPAGTTSKEAYASISGNLETWIEQAIKARSDAG